MKDKGVEICQELISVYNTPQGNTECKLVGKNKRREVLSLPTSQFNCGNFSLRTEVTL